MKGIIGKKIGMTSIFDSNGKQVACTIIEAGPCVVTQKKSIESDGYESIQIAYGARKEKNTPKALINHFEKANTTPKAYVRELRNSSIDKQVGEEITVDIFKEGEKVNVIGTSKGKGFQGVVKRHGFAGVGESTHGQKNRQRHPGSIGHASTPAKVFKGKKMAGRMGGVRSKVRALEILKVFPEKNYLLVRGSVPGYNGSIVVVEQK